MFARWICRYSCAAFIFLLPLPKLSAEITPSPAPANLNEIVRVVAERAAKPPPLKYLYSKSRVVEELDRRGAVTDRSERQFLVTPIGGLPFSRLLARDGQLLSPEEAAHQQDREERFRQRVAAGRAGKPKEIGGVTLTPELLSALKFTWEGIDQLNGRKCYVIDLGPSGKKTGITKIDLILPHASGRAWVDAEDLEAVRLELSLKSPVEIAWGLIGKVESFACTLDRVRLEHDQWVMAKLEGEAAYRKLLSSKRTRWREEASAINKAVSLR